VKSHYDAVIIGGGHNGITAAAYLARAGKSVLVLERLSKTGGAAVSKRAFDGHPARLSRYSYLVSLLPGELVADLDLDVKFASRSVASYTPWHRHAKHDGLLVERPEGAATRASFVALTGAGEEYDAWQRFYADMEEFAAVVAPTLLTELPRERDIASAVDPVLWHDIVQRPLGESIERRFTDDLVRGVVSTDALIGTFASMHDPSLVQNRCFLYHLIGNGTGEWKVPVGGMGAVTDALLDRATAAGATIKTGAGVSAVAADGSTAEVTWHDGGKTRTVTCDTVLANVAPWVLQILLGGTEEPELKPAGAQLKVNFLLDRLPALKSGLDPAVAFAGTLHLSEEYSRLEASYIEAARGQLPTYLPGEVYCHSLTDPSILNGFSGHTLTYFGLHTPAALFENPSVRDEAVARVLASINRYLAEPIETCLATDAHGKPCLEVKTPQDIEDELAMPGGHIFHGDLDWPWASNRALLDSPAQRWGVATDTPNVIMCGSGARRGGAVSGIGGHNAAMAVLDA